MIGNINNIRLYAFSSGTTLVQESLLDRATNLQFSKVYPGGIYAGLTFDLPVRDITAAWSVVAANRIVALNGLDIVWEGRVTNLGYSLTESAQYRRVECIGYWGDVLMLRGIRKPWADTRISEDVWVRRQPAAGVPEFDFCTIDRQNRILLKPNSSKAWAINNVAGIQYTAPTGQTIKRVTMNYAFDEKAQDWRFGLYNYASSSNELSVTSTSSSAADITLSTPANKIELYMQSLAAQTPTEGVQTLITSLTVYTETGAINLTEIAKDVAGYVTELSADTRLIGSNTYSLVPFIADPDTYADILNRAASFGDSSYNAWACGIRASSYASDSKPILFVEQQPTLTDYDYEVSVAEPNYLAPAEFDQDVNAVRNWIAAGYRNEHGQQQWVTPDDDVNLKDSASIARYGQREEWIAVDTESSTTATNFARRYLAANKYPQWRASGGIILQSYVQTKGGVISVSEMEPGKRIRVRDYLDDMSGIGLLWMITATDYDDSSEQVRLSVGVPDQLDVQLARIGKERN